MNGSVLAAKASVENGWGINIGGGFHHCSSTRGGGFCAYADITLCVHVARRDNPGRVSKVMIVDLDAHQGNGHERDFRDDKSVYIFDAFNPYIYPHDVYARERIDKVAELPSGVADDEYIGIVRRCETRSLNLLYATCPVRWSNFDRQDPKMGVFLQSTEATPCGHLLK